MRSSQKKRGALFAFFLYWFVVHCLAWSPPVIQWDGLIQDVGESINGAVNKVLDEVDKQSPGLVGEAILPKITKLIAGTTFGINDIKEAIDQLVHQAHEIHQEILKFEKMGAEEIFEALASELEVVYEQLKKEIVSPLPEDYAERAVHRERLAKHVLEIVRPVYVKILSGPGSIPKEKAEAQFDELVPKLIHVVIITGQLCDEHPIIPDSIILSISMFILPEIRFLRPILSLLGFGPLMDTGKGNPAGWLQSRFWGTLGPNKNNRIKVKL